MIERTIRALFIFAIALILILDVFLLTGAHADNLKAMTELRSTALMVNGAQCSGSGAIVEARSGGHYLLTNSHVCLCANHLGYVNATFDSGELVHAKIVKQDWSSDLCAARVEKTRPALKLGSQLLPMMEVYTRGYPGGRLTESHGAVKGDVLWDWDVEIETIGSCPVGSRVIRGFNGTLRGCSMTFTSTISSLYSRPGASGSAVVNDDGQLVGVLSSWHPGDDYDAGQVPFSQLRKFLEAL